MGNLRSKSSIETRTVGNILDAIEEAYNGTRIQIYHRSPLRFRAIQTSLYRNRGVWVHRPASLRFTRL